MDLKGEDGIWMGKTTTRGDREWDLEVVLKKDWMRESKTSS